MLARATIYRILNLHIFLWVLFFHSCSILLKRQSYSSLLICAFLLLVHPAMSMVSSSIWLHSFSWWCWWINLPPKLDELCLLPLLEHLRATSIPSRFAPQRSINCLPQGLPCSTIASFHFLVMVGQDLAPLVHPQAWYKVVFWKATVDNQVSISLLHIIIQRFQQGPY